MKILCVGDSLGLPRKGVKYEDTWFYKLSDKYRDIHFIAKFVRELTTDRFEPIGDFSDYYNPDVVITQFGIVDCAPRIINERLRKWKMILSLSSMLKFDKLVWKVIKNKYHRDNPNVVYIQPAAFENNVKRYFEKLQLGGAKLIIVVKICTPGSSVKEKSPCMVDNVKKYNAIFDKVASQFEHVITIDPLSEGDDINYVDGYHTNDKGFQIVFNQLEKVLIENEVICKTKK